MEKYIIDGLNKLLTLEEAKLVATDMAQKKVLTILSEPHTATYEVDVGDSDYTHMVTKYHNYSKVKKNISIENLRLCVEILESNFFEKIKKVKIND